MFLSIITINRNNAEGLKKTLESVASQTCRDFEHIIIDGASTDGSVDVIKDYVASPSGKNVSYWISEPDSGIYNAMNKGIKKASGDYISLLNSGDWYEPDACAIISENAEKTVTNNSTTNAQNFRCITLLLLPSISKFPRECYRRGRNKLIF